jgi:hypothetical protein
MDVLCAINPATEPLERSAQMNSEEQAISTFWEAELGLSSDFKPPNLREISNRTEPAEKQHTVDTKYKQR